jgi:hypothetical protein
VNRAECIFFWQGGVISGEFDKLIFSAINQLYSDVNISPFNQDFLATVEKLSLGEIGFDDFCISLSETLKVDINPKNLKNQISKRIILYSDVLEVAKELIVSHEIWMISDFTPEFQAAIHKNSNLKEVFNTDNTILCSSAKLTRTVPDIFFRSTAISRHPMENCMLVDNNSQRAVTALRMGLSSIIFVDVSRFRRELVLRKILPPSSIDYQPKKLQKGI